MIAPPDERGIALPQDRSECDCDRFVSFTLGFSQVSPTSVFKGNRLNGFPNDLWFQRTRLKPGVHETRFTLLRQSNS